MTYDGLGNLLTVDGPLAGAGDTARFRYNPARELIGTVSPDPDGSGSLKHRATRNTYTNGLLTKVESGTVNSQSDSDWSAFNALQAVETIYDAYARPTVQKLVSGGTNYALAQTSYDALGRADCVAQRMNPAIYGALPSSACSLGTAGAFGNDRIAKTEFDAVGRVWKVNSALGTAETSVEVTNGYSDNGQLVSVTDAEGNKTSYEYDGFDRLRTTRYPVATVAAGASSMTDYEQLAYDAASNVVSRRQRDGQTITYGYDNLNKLILSNGPNLALWDPDIAYTYDLLGRLISASGNGVITLAYDALDRRTSETITSYGTKTSAYDLAGRRTRLTWPDGFYADYDYNVVGDMTAIRENGATSGVGVLAAYGYDDLGRRTGMTRGNGTTTNYGYDTLSRLSSLTHDVVQGTYDVSYYFTHNPANQIASATRANDTYAWNGHYNVDRSTGVNGLNQATSSGPVTLGYDGRGNLTSSGNATYTYTADSRLATAPGSNYGYDPLGRLFVESTAHNVHSYDGSQLIMESSNVDGSIKRRYVPGPGVDEPVVWYEGAGTSDRRWLHADERGSVVAVTDASGNAIGVNRYDEYGIPASTNIGRFQYTGQAWLPELGMYYYKARIYSPTLGRFVQTDPLGYEDGVNWYNYVSSDPINSTDPSGLRGDGTTTENTDSWSLMARLGGAEWDHDYGNIIAGGHNFTFGWVNMAGDGLALRANASVAWDHLTQRREQTLTNVPRDREGYILAGEATVSPGFTVEGKPVRIGPSSSVKVTTYSPNFVQSNNPRNPGLPIPIGEVKVGGVYLPVRWAAQSTYRFAGDIGVQVVNIIPQLNTPKDTTVRIYYKPLGGR
jgi:RHS repeat-associated protein